MIVNVEDVMVGKPKFSSLLYISLAFVLFFSVAYRKGAGDMAGTTSLVVMLICYAITFGYPLVVYLQFISRRKQAVQVYKQHCSALTEEELKDLRAQPKLSKFSKKYVDHVGISRFG
jgi:hypothetical protein